MAQDQFHRDAATMTTTPPDLAAPDLVPEGDDVTAAETVSAYAKDAQSVKSDGATPGQGSAAPALDSVKETMGQAMEKAQDTAGKVMTGVAQQTTSQLAAQKDQAAETISTTAQAARQTGQSLREQNQAVVAQYVETLADQAERVSRYLRERDIQALLDDAESLARQQPAVFVGGAFVLGLLGARFLKSSRRQQGYGASQSAMVSAPRSTDAWTGYGGTATQGMDTGYGGTATRSMDAGYSGASAASDIRGFDAGRDPAADALGDDAGLTTGPRATPYAELPADPAEAAQPTPYRRQAGSATDNGDGSARGQ